MSETMNSPKKKTLPTHKEVEKLVQDAFPKLNAMCPLLCKEFETAWELLQHGDLSTQQRGQVLARLHSIEVQLLKLHCKCDDVSAGKTTEHKKLPTHEEIEKMVHEAFPIPHSICTVVCEEVQNAVDAVDDAPTPQAKARAIVRLRAITSEAKRLNCHCVPQ